MFAPDEHAYLMTRIQGLAQNGRANEAGRTGD
jgi:hypothetical protein